MLDLLVLGRYYRDEFNFFFLVHLDINGEEGWCKDCSLRFAAKASYWF